MRFRPLRLLCLLLVIGAACANGVRADEQPATVIAAWEAEAYRDGGADIAYHDATPGNNGPGRAEDVDLGRCADGAECVSVDDWTSGDWVSYDTPALQGGTYQVRLRLAVPGPLAALRVSFSGGKLDGFLRVPLLAWSTGGPESWAEVVTRPVRLPDGPLTLYVVQAGTQPMRVNRLQLLRRDAPVEQPAPAPPTAVPLPPPAPTDTPSLPAPASAVQRFAWFYKPPGDGTPAETLAHRAHMLVLTHNDEEYRDRLLGLGVAPERIHQYIMANEIQDPGGCDRQPWGNNAAWHTGDFCRIRDNHPDWFLRDPDGRAVWSEWDGYRWYVMDPGNAGWQTFLIGRLREAADRYGWRGVFLDNLDGNSKRGGIKGGYRSAEAYQAAVDGFLARIRAEHIDARGFKLYANVTLRPDDAVWHRYLRLLDGAMEESCLLDWNTDDDVRYLSPERWERELRLIEATQAAGKTIVCVVQGQAHDGGARRFAYASYLLAAHGSAMFRYTDGNNYGRFVEDHLFTLELGAPLGPRYRDGALWRRDFERAGVAVDPATRQASIVER